MLRRVLLHGEFGRRFGREHQLDVATPAEALRALRANFGAKFEAYFREMAQAPFRVLIGDDIADVPRLLQPVGNETIRFVPVVEGGTKSPYWGIIIGIALFAISGPVGSAIGWSAGSAAAISQGIAAVGISLALSGVAQLLTKTPSLQNPEAQAMSNAFGGAVNTTGQGNPIPVGYGELLVGGQMISAGLFPEAY